MNTSYPLSKPSLIPSLGTLEVLPPEVRRRTFQMLFETLPQLDYPYVDISKGLKVVEDDTSGACNRCITKDMRALALTSRKMHEEALPVFFETVRVLLGREAAGIKAQADGFFHMLPHFRNLELRDYPGGPYVDTDPLISFNPRRNWQEDGTEIWGRARGPMYDEASRSGYRSLSEMLIGNGRQTRCSASASLALWSPKNTTGEVEWEGMGETAESGLEGADLSKGFTAAIIDSAFTAMERAEWTVRKGNVLAAMKVSPNGPKKDWGPGCSGHEF